MGGTVKCDRESLTKANENADPNFVKLVDWNCDQGWAVTTINTKDVTDEKTVFKAEGQFWIPAPSGYCGTVNPEDPTTIPDDATIPAKLYPDHARCGGQECPPSLLHCTRPFTFPEGK